MGYIDSGKSQGATVHYGGHRIGDEGYFISPTIFTDTKPDMKIVQEEIFGPVCVVIKFKDDDGEPLVGKILDAAGQKGTGKWTAINALDAGMPGARQRSGGARYNLIAPLQ